MILNKVFIYLLLTYYLVSESLEVIFLLSSFKVKDGVVRYIFRIGDRMKILRLGGANVTDGNYHNLTIRREGDFATAQLDDKIKAEGRTGGSFTLLDLSGGTIFIGGVPYNLTAVLVSGKFPLSTKQIIFTQSFFMFILPFGNK